MEGQEEEEREAVKLVGYNSLMWVWLTVAKTAVYIA